MGKEFVIYFNNGIEENKVCCFDQRDLDEYYAALVKIYGIKKVRKEGEAYVE